MTAAAANLVYVINIVYKDAVERAAQRLART